MIKATYIDHMGSDLSVVNAAKVSFGKRSGWENEDEVWIAPRIDATRYEMMNPWVEPLLSDKDQGLIRFLARGCTSGDWDKALIQVYEYCEKVCDLESHGDDAAAETEEGFLVGLLNHIRKMPSHWSPFAHTAISLHLKMPIFVARQIMKHTTGIEYNEVSRGYVDDELEFYVPDVWRSRSEDKKQGSSNEAVDVRPLDALDGVLVIEDPCSVSDLSIDMYKHLLDQGVAPEQARMVLPQSMYTEVIMTGNLYAIANLYNQRTDSHAQEEAKILAKQIGEVVKPLYPVSWEALTA